MANVINISQSASENDIFAMFDCKRRNQVRKSESSLLQSI